MKKKNLALLIPNLTRDEFDWCRALLKPVFGRYVDTRSEIMLVDAQELLHRLKTNPHFYSSGTHWDLVFRALERKLKVYLDEE